MSDERILSRELIPQNAVASVAGLLGLLDAMLDLGGELVSLSRQVAPELHTEPVADAGAGMDDARAAALARAAAAAPMSTPPNDPHE
ncbi:MAG: hypothetical protein WKG00_03395 [Polyangiaceae bacterium]